MNNGYDTYDEAIVVAENEEQAKRIHPNGHEIINKNTFDEYSSSWIKNVYSGNTS